MSLSKPINIRRKKRGFTLVEVLFALVIFAFGVLGVAQYTGNALAAVADNNAKSMAINAASQRFEPLYLSAATSAATFKAVLDTFTGAGQQVTANNGLDTYTITVTEGIDSSATPINLLTSLDPSTWVSPLTIAATISYSGRSGTSTTNASYTFITP